MDDIGDKRNRSGMRPSDFDPGAVVGLVLGSDQHPQTAEIEALFTGQIEPARAQAVIQALRRESMYMAVFDDLLSIARDASFTGTSLQVLAELDALYHAIESGPSQLQQLSDDPSQPEWVRSQAKASLHAGPAVGKLDPP